MRFTCVSSAVAIVSFVLALGASGCSCGDGGVVPGGDGGDAGDTDGGRTGDGGRDDGGSCAAVETCNGSDDDCDGRTDEDASEACGTDVGACTAGIAQCEDGSPGTCEGEVAATDEVCNGLDDDCDAMTDETCPCTDGATQACGSSTGECEPGVQTCAGGAWGACVGEVDSVAELCNGLDDNCDGIVDDGFSVGVSCDGADSDMCEEGTTACSTDGSSAVCSDTSGDVAETCDGTIDDDCDLSVDEGCSCMDGMTRPCGSAVGECAEGTQTCTAGTWAACSGETPPSAELCNTLDDDCDGMTDEAFTLGGDCDGADGDACDEGVIVCDPSGVGTACDDTTSTSTESCNGADDDCDGPIDEGMAALSCGVGACAVTTPACVSGVPQTCTPGPSSAEACNAVDDDCNGMVDDGLGTISCGVGACLRSVPACTGGVMGVCVPGTGTAETCNGLDDDCNGMVDDGLGTITCGTGICTTTVQACVGGAPQTCTPGPSTAEICNGLDDDCDGTADDGNPGGGVACGGADVGGCIARTACVGGMLDCTGTFVAPPSSGGTATGDGSRASPLSSISAAIANATALGGGADVCVCAATSATFTENVTMAEGTSVLGAYDCTTWTRPGGRTTIIQDNDVDGLVFPAGITSATMLESMTVEGQDMSGIASGTTAITIQGSAPTLQGVTAHGGDTTSSTAIRCVGCSATLTNTSAAGGAATMIAIGFHGTGTLTGLNVTNGNFGGGSTSGMTGSTFGVRLEGCTGSPTFMAASSFGGGGGAGAPAVGTRTGFDVTGAMCSPAITGGRHRGCEVASGTCIGMSCSMGALCDVTNAIQIMGATGATENTYGLRCLSGGCDRIVGSTIQAGNLRGNAPTGIGLEIDGGAGTLIDDDVITGPGGSTTASAMTRFYGAYLRSTSAVLSNNVILDGLASSGSSGFNGAIEVVRLDILTIGPAARNVSVHSNTIQYSSCTACGPRIGFGVAGTPGGLSSPSGIVRNNIIEHGGVGGTTRPVVEHDTGADFFVFENNDLFDITAGPLVYLDEGTTPLTIAMVNGLAGAAANIGADCNPDATWHIPAGSMCVDAGTATGAPRADFDGMMRGPMFDIGADER